MNEKHINMKVEFIMNHQVEFGKSIYICGSLPELGNGDESKSIAMSCIEASRWSIELDMNAEDDFEYFYLIKEYNSYHREWGNARKVKVLGNQHLVLEDFWSKVPQQNFLYTSAFTDSFFAHEKSIKASKSYKHTTLLKVNCPYVDKNQQLILLGEADFLGKWQTEKALAFDYEGKGIWSLALPSSKIKQPLQYKLAIQDTSNGSIVHWEERLNRELYPFKKPSAEKGLYTVSVDYEYKWINWRAAGVAIPVFSIRTEKSAGVGDFADIKIFADWAAATGQKVIQILPINDTTITHKWTDSYPYNAISIYALHPQYFALSPYTLKDAKLQAKFSKEAAKLNALDKIDYEKVIQLKEAFIDALYEEIGKETLKSDGFKTFFKTNEYWLFPYAVFSVLRDVNGTADYTQWKAFNKYDKKALEAYVKSEQKVKDRANRQYFTQYLLHVQLLDAANYVHSKGLILKGDIPIGISHDSVEAWTEPHLFNLDTQTGAPPDDFSVYGQNWGFPTYNWDAMAKEGYRWWINRFRKMADYFDAYRIDHILGFFRIWEIPVHSVQGLLGYFSPALPFTVNEIQQAGLYFDKQRMTKPFIHEYFLWDVFGEYKDEVIGTYLQPITWQRFELKEAYNTQKKIQATFAAKEDEKSLRIRDGLYALCNEVLFVQDKREPEKYHPRISAQHTYSYRSLDDHDKTIFNRLYDHFFYHRHNEFWAAQAIQKLPPLINSTEMLVCGEDLGMIPDCVPDVMNQLQILSLEIQRMPKDPSVKFANLAHLPYLSISTTSTHDMSPIRAWWNEDRGSTQSYYNEMLWQQGEAPQDCTPEIAELILKSHLYSPAMLTIIPLQDWLAISKNLRFAHPEGERINIPAIAQHYWRYRMHLTVEQLIQETEFNNHLQQLLSETWR